MSFLVVAFCFTVAVIKAGQTPYCGVYDCACEYLASTGYCGFYPLCVEENLRYGETPIAYGYRYCRQFNQSDCFTNTVGQDWEQSSRICLMKAILDISDQSSCDDLEMFAFSSRPKCFFENEFCSDILLSLDDLRCLANTLQGTDFFNKLSFQQVFDTAINCSRKNADDFLSVVDDWISNTASLSVTSKHLLQTLKDLFQGCSNGVDMMLVLDSSGSIGPANFTLLRNFTANNLIPHFNIGPDDTRVGVIRYSQEASIVIPLGSINNAELLQSAIRNILYIGRGTLTHSALDLLIAEFNAAGDRTNQGIPKVAIVFTDGVSDSPPKTIRVAKKVHDANITVYSFGIGSDINDAELDAIASSPGNKFKIHDFSSAQFANVLLKLEILTCLTTAIVDIGQRLQISLEMREYRFLQYNSFPTEGMTLKIDISEGEVQIFGSFSIQNPTPLTADFSVNQLSGCIDYYISPDSYQGGRERIKCQTEQFSGVYISIIGLNNVNTFSLNTATGISRSCTTEAPLVSTEPAPDTPSVIEQTDECTCSAALVLKAVYQIPLFAVLLTIMTLLLYS